MSMIMRMIHRLQAWMEIRANMRRYNRGRRDYEAAIGANLRFVENHIKK